MSNMNQSLRVLAMLANADHEAFLAGATAARCAAEGVEMAVSQQATAAVMRAPDPRYGHTCCSRGAHTVRKHYYMAANGPITTRIDADTYYRAFGTVGGGLSSETDLFDGLRPSPTRLAVAA